MSEHLDQSRAKYVFGFLVVTCTMLTCFLVLDEIQNREKVENETESKISEADDTTKPKDFRKIIAKEKKRTKQFPIRVYVRIRPLVGKEIEEKHDSLSYSIKKVAAKKSKKKGKNNKKTKETKTFAISKNGRISKQYTGFTNILEPNATNKDTFTTCILPCLSSMLNGDSSCVFAYGHTGSGKTHTIFGYGKENPGMYEQFAIELLTNADIFSNENDSSDENENDLWLQVRFTELYQGKVKDLLSKDKEECFLREDSSGRIRLRPNPKASSSDGKIRNYPVTGINCKKVDKLMDVVNTSVKSRNVGNSTVHDKSSRSHAFLEYEIVCDELLSEKQKIIELEADILKYEIMIDLIQKQNKSKLGLMVGKKGLTQEDIELIKDYDIVDTWKFKDEIKKLEKEIKQVEARIEEILNDKDRPYIGGTMVFVDLAGNEYGRDAGLNENLQEQRERNEINQSLLALKECIRSLHSNKNHVGYRNSKLTMYLRKYLKGDTSNAIMISNVGSSANFEKQTSNTLKYTSLVANA